MAPTCSSLDGGLVDSSSGSSFPGDGGTDLGAVLVSVAVILWLCRYGSFLSQIFINLVLYFLDCKLLNMSSLFKGLSEPPLEIT